MSEQRKTAIVTGASGDIGYAVAKAFIDHDYNVVLTGTNEDKLKSARASSIRRFRASGASMSLSTTPGSSNRAPSSRWTRPISTGS